MKKFNIIISASAICLLTAVSCDKWTTPENIDYTLPSIEESDPAGYAKYLRNLRDFKQSSHNITILSMNGVSGLPANQSQHLTAMPDSAAYITLNIGKDGLNPAIAAEISYVREKKGTKTLAYVNYAEINEAWSLLEDERSEQGKEPGTEAEHTEFIRSSTTALLENSTKYGMDGVYVMYQGADNAWQHAYIKAASDFMKANSGLECIFAGTVRNINDTSFLNDCDYIVVIPGSDKKLTTVITTMIDHPDKSFTNKKRVLIEISVPSEDNPDQEGSSPEEAASWLLGELKNKDFTPKGIVIKNAHDNYYTKEYSFQNIRRAISIMNPQTTE